MIEHVSAADVVSLRAVIVRKERRKVGRTTRGVVGEGLLQALERTRLRFEAPARGDRVIARCRVRRIRQPPIGAFAGDLALGLREFCAETIDPRSCRVVTQIIGQEKPLQGLDRIRGRADA